MIADIAVQDANGRYVLLVEVQGMIVSADLLPQILAWMETEGEPVPYGMVADPESIYVFKYDCDNPIGFTCKFKTADVLRLYEPEFGKKRIFQRYLRTLIETWLYDLDFHWKSETPPGSEQLAAIGLLPLLNGATTLSEVPLGADAVR